MFRILLFSTLVILISSCQMEPSKSDLEKWKTEITNTEKAFAQMAKDSGVAAAFLHFAAEEAVLSRNNRTYEGMAEIREYFDNQTLQNVSLNWIPDFVDVASSGDLGYTHGRFSFSATDTTGNPVEAIDIFHTVWKRQSNGEWRYVWD
jgi:ketosteroid isomerase-like protein